MKQGPQRAPATLRPCWIATSSPTKRSTGFDYIQEDPAGTRRSTSTTPVAADSDELLVSDRTSFLGDKDYYSAPSDGPVSNSAYTRVRPHCRNWGWVRRIR